MPTGRVKRFHLDKSFGFITPDAGGRDLFVHISEVKKAGMDDLVAGQRLAYDVMDTPKGPNAVNLKRAAGALTSSSSRNPSAMHRPESRRNRQGTGAHPAGPARGDLHTICGYGSNEEDIVFDSGYQATDRRGNPRPAKVESLKVTDRFLDARPGSKFEIRGSEMTLKKYADDVCAGIHGAPDVDQNPYNFAPWIGPKPTRAHEPKSAAHDRERADRRSGSIRVTFTAQTPVFVPVGELGDADTGASRPNTPKEFFHCWDGECERYAIPGSSVKGAVRSLFEALTNSRAGATDETTLKHPPLYRRRSFKLYRITSVPTPPTQPGTVEECEYGLHERNGKLNHRTTQLPAPDHGNGVYECDFAANLFWVGPSNSKNRPHGHTHRWTTIRYRPTGKHSSLDFDTVRRFESMKDHPHLKDHGGLNGTAAGAATCFYGQRGKNSHAPEYSSIERALFGLKVGDLVFGIPDRKNERILCFGRNVNFLWPADKSALGLMGKYAARAPEDSKLAGSDSAEAVFGFVGAHRDGSHPFQGRVRFGTFWGPELTDESLKGRASLRLMPLTSPSGTKAKARPLYLKPRDGEAADHDGNAELRGRKFYWHQKGEKGQVPSAHQIDKLSRGVPDNWTTKIDSQLPEPILPLPAQTQFCGTIHFNNLTSEELGALLVAVKPDVAFDRPDDKTKYGIMIGKGKPRGLGSVTSCMELEIDNRPEDRYKCLGQTKVRTPSVPGAYVCAYKKWIGSGRRWGDLDLVKTLQALLRVPDQLSTRVYPPHFNMYGWLPKPNDAHGAPQGARPKAMKTAH